MILKFSKRQEFQDWIKILNALGKEREKVDEFNRVKVATLELWFRVLKNERPDIFMSTSLENNALKE